jgi:hypothetical protein
MIFHLGDNTHLRCKQVVRVILILNCVLYLVFFLREEDVLSVRLQFRD